MLKSFPELDCKISVSDEINKNVEALFFVICPFRASETMQVLGKVKRDISMRAHGAM